MSLQDLKVKSFATTPSLLKRDEGTVRGLDECTDCTITTDDACLPQTCGLTCGMTYHGENGTTGGGGGGGCSYVSDYCGAQTIGCINLSTQHDHGRDCHWGLSI
jgi:hypothetical protein